MKYFVYDLIDPRTGKTFYVGKGQGKRPYNHMAEARAGVKGYKCNLIRKILAFGLLPEVKIAFRTDNEDLAYAMEVRRIADFGLRNLTNVLPGGVGVTGMSRECTIADLPLFEAATITPMPHAEKPRPPMWTARNLEKLATSLARHTLLVANGCGVMFCDLNVSKLAMNILNNFVRELGIRYVKERLTKEHLYFLVDDVVQIEPHVMASIKEHFKNRKNPQNLNVLTTV